MSNSDNIFNNSLQEKDAKDKFNKNPEDKDKDISNFINQENKEELSNIDKGIQNNLNSHDAQYRTININLPITDDELILLQTDSKIKDKLIKIFDELNEECNDEFELNIHKSQVLANSELYFEAVCYLNNALLLKKDNEALFKKAKYTYELGLNEEALNLTVGILDKSPESYDPLKFLTILLASLKRYDDADIIFNKARTINPDDITLYQEYADETASTGNFDKALEINNMALNLFSNHLDLLYDRRYYLITINAPSDLIDKINNEIQAKEKENLDEINPNDQTEHYLNEENSSLNDEIQGNDFDSDTNNESPTKKSYKIHPQKYESLDNENSDENDIYDLASEDRHFDDEENIIDLEYDDKEDKKDTDILNNKQNSNKNSKEMSLDKWLL